MKKHLDIYKDVKKTGSFHFQRISLLYWESKTLNYYIAQIWNLINLFNQQNIYL